MYNIGTKIMILRKLQGYTQAQIADYLGVTKEYIDEIEQNKRNITLSVLCKISTLFCVQITDMLHTTVDDTAVAIVNNVGVLSKEDMKAISVVNNIAINASNMTCLIEDDTDTGVFTEEERKIYKDTIQEQAIKTGIHVL